MACDPRQQLVHVAAVARQTARMTRARHDWPEDYWQRKTSCPDWTAADAIAHLATGADFYAQVITSGRRGDPLPPWGVSNAAEMRPARHAAGRKLIEAGSATLIEGFERESATLQEVFALLREADLSQKAWHPRGLVPIGAWIGMRVNELVIHDWDVRQPHEAQAGLAPDALPAMCSCLPEMQWQFLAQRHAGGLDGIHVLCAGEVSWAFRVHDDTVTYLAEAPTEFDTCARADAESLILLTMGRAEAEDKLQSGVLAIEGDAEKGQRLCDTLFRTF